MALESTSETGSNSSEKRPGAILKAARESGGHSLEAVSADTRITCSRLMALEADDYPKVGAHPFIIGYIRKYAKWLGLDGDELVRSYEQRIALESGQAESDASAPGRHESDRPPARDEAPARSGRKMSWLWLVVVLAVLWVAAAIFLSGREEAPESAAPGAADSTPESTATESVDDSDDLPAGSAPTDDAAGEAQETEPAGPSARLEPLGREGSGVGGPREPASREPAPSEPVPTAPALSEPAPSEQSEPAVEVPAEEAEPVPGTDSLSMTFTDQCWVHVTDANGDVLFAQLQEAGDNLRLIGRAPFQVMLGNARAVDLQVNGRTVDTTPRPNSDTRRLRVGP